MVEGLTPPQDEMIKQGTKSEDFVVPTNEEYDPKKGIPTATNDVRGKVVAGNSVEGENKNTSDSQIGNTSVTGGLKE